MIFFIQFGVQGILMTVARYQFEIQGCGFYDMD